MITDILILCTRVVEKCYLAYKRRHPYSSSGVQELYMGSSWVEEFKRFH